MTTARLRTRSGALEDLAGRAISPGLEAQNILVGVLPSDICGFFLGARRVQKCPDRAPEDLGLLGCMGLRQNVF